MKRSPFLSFQKPLRVAVVAAERADCAAVRALSSSCCSGIDGYHSLVVGKPETILDSGFLSWSKLP